MADTLKIQSPLAGKAMSLGETYLDAVEGFSLTSLAVPRKGEAAFAEAVACLRGTEPLVPQEDRQRRDRLGERGHERSGDVGLLTLVARSVEGHADDNLARPLA